MKKVFFSLMAALVAIPVFFSCVEKEQELPVIEEKPVVPTEYTYSFDIADGETRARLTEEGVLWDNNDPVGLYVQSGDSPATHMGTEVLVQEGSSPKVVFSTAEPLAAGTQVYAYYPYQAGSAGVDAAKIVFPKTQQGGGVSAMPMAGLPVEVRQGEGANGIIRFLNLGAVIDFRVYSASHAGERIQSITFAVNSGAFVSGEATLDVSGVSSSSEGFSIPALTWTAGESSVTLTQDATVALNKELASQNNLFMVVAPGTYDGTITIVTNAATYSFDFANIVLERNGIKGFNMNLDGSKATRSNEYVRVNSLEDVVSGGTYLIVYESESKVFHPILNADGSTYKTSGNAESAIITNNRIQVSSGTAVDASRVILEKVSGTTSDYYIKVPSANDSYFYLSSSAFKLGQNASTLSFDQNGKVTFKRSGSTYYLNYRNSAFTSYRSSTSLALYTPDRGGLQAQALQFSEHSFSCNIFGLALPVINVAGVPTLSGAQTNVTYYSSDPSVAFVSSDGSITVWKDGKVVITALAEANDQYEQGLASYTLTVWNGFNLENDMLAQYLDRVDARPYNPPADYSITYMTSDLYSGNTNQTNRLDWPKPVSVSWTNPAQGNATKVIHVYNDADLDGVVNENDFELSVPITYSSSTTADIFNLIPNRAYYYEVINGNDAEPVASGSFRTAGRRRMIKVGDSPYGKGYANNCRDFGGQVTADGTKMIKYGKMFRGSNMDLTSDEAKAVLKDYLKIGLDVDLRRDQHVESWDGYQGDGNNIINDALNLGDDWHTTQSFGSWEDLSSPTKMNDVLTRVFSAVASNRGVYIHCMVGADRTGYVCMLIEAILGIGQGGCDVDYELTSFSGAVDSGKPRLRTGANNHYYFTKTSYGVTTVQGVDYINTLPGNTFQEKAIYWVVNNTSLTQEDIIAFQNNMLEDLN